MKGSLAVALAISLAHAGLAWGGLIAENVSKVPSNLITPVGPQSGTVQKFTSIACYDIGSGNLLDCGFDLTIDGLTQPASDVANNGGHTHNLSTHPVGTLRIVAPITAGPSASLAGQTSFDVFVISHEIPQVSGKIETVLNLRVPPGWHTVSPESCDGSGTSWCFLTRIDVGLNGLASLPDGGPFYTKVRGGAPAHADAVAYSGTPDAIVNLTEIAETYNQLTNNLLSINDMSLLKGGIFDITNNYARPHNLHRVGNSADINKTQGDCRANYDLMLAVNLIMPAEAGSFFARRTLPSSGRFLCESNGNIHIDLDGVPPPPPSPFQ